MPKISLSTVVTVVLPLLLDNVLFSGTFWLPAGCCQRVIAANAPAVGHDHYPTVGPSQKDGSHTGTLTHKLRFAANCPTARSFLD